MRAKKYLKQMERRKRKRTGTKDDMIKSEKKSV